MNLPRCLLLTVLASLPLSTGRWAPLALRQPEELFLHNVYQKTDHGIATFDTKNHWIKFEALDDDVLLTVDVKRASNSSDNGGIPKVISSLTYHLNSARDSVSHVLPSKGSKGTVVCLETYTRDFLHYSYVFSY